MLILTPAYWVTPVISDYSVTTVAPSSFQCVLDASDWETSEPRHLSLGCGQDNLTHLVGNRQRDNQQSGTASLDEIN